MLQTFLSDGRMREFLTQARTIAVVGAKDKEGQKLSFRSEYCDFNEPSLRKIPENPYTATIKIAEGCNNICTYCIIPHT